MKVTVDQLLKSVTSGSVKEQKDLILTFANQHAKYDSTSDTLTHIKRVNELLLDVISKLIKRAQVHDASKLRKFEKEAFDKFTPKLKGSTYGSEEYKKNLKGLGKALEHHYAHNSHHPENNKHGISGMNLLDIIEMLVDWKAATERHADGDLKKSLEINKDRFSIDSQLNSILHNTARDLGFIN